MGIRRKGMTGLPAVVVIVAAILVGLVLSIESSGGFSEPECDDDGILDTVDNCMCTDNPGQRDDDLDGYGNICDADLNQDCIVGGADTSFIGAFWLSAPPWAPNPAGQGTTGAFDINEDNVVGGADTSFIGGNWLGPAGPSGYACSGWCSGTTQVGPPPASCP